MPYEKRPKPCVLMCTGWQVLLLGVCLWCWSCTNRVNQPNKLLRATVSLLFYLIVIVDSTKYLHIHICENRNAW